MPIPTICAYAIFKDEEPRVARWVETTADCDGRFVLDTGSSDGTITELERLGVPHASARFEPFRFDDARNAALALVPDDYDFVLRLDADETLAPGWREAFQRVYDPTVLSYRYTVVNNGGPKSTWAKIQRDDLHARHGFRWRLPTHEVLDGPPLARVALVSGMIVDHYPETKDRSFNLAVLERATLEDPYDRRMSFYFARELWYMGYWDKCRSELQRFLNFPNGWAPERCEAFRILAAIDDFPERWLWKAIAESPQRREPWMDLFRLLRKEGRTTEAGAAATLARQRTDETIYTTDPTCWGAEAEAELTSS